MRDQYDNTVPTDLVCFPPLELLDEGDINTVDDADWFEAEHAEIGRVLLVSAKEIDYLEESSLEDATGIRLEDCQVQRVAACLHRYNDVDGFYHA